MTRIRTLFTFSLIFFLLVISGCKEKKEQKPPDDKNKQPAQEQLGRYLFETPTGFSETGTVDLPRLSKAPGGDMHLVYILKEENNHIVKYTRYEKGEFIPPVYLSNDPGTKVGGAYIASFTEKYIVGYWINVKSTAGQFIYRISDDGGVKFSLEKQMNRRPEARNPLIIPVGNDDVGYFFVRASGSWDLISVRNYAAQDEAPVYQAQGTPYRFQGFADKNNVWLAYFERPEKAGGGRIVLLRSTDGGENFDRKYLFDDLMIPSLTNYFLMQSRPGDPNSIHVIFSEDQGDSTVLYYARSEDGGENFTSPVALLESEIALTQSPLLLVNGNYVFILTADVDDEGPALRYMISEDKGKTFEPVTVATREISGPETFTGVLDPNGDVYIVWDDIAGKEQTGEQLFLLKGTIRGKK